MDATTLLCPIADRVLVERDPVVDQIGLIAIPEIAQAGTRRQNPGRGAPTFWGIVRAIGPGAWMNNGERRAAEVKPGDRVLFQAPFGGYGSDERLPIGHLTDDLLVVNESEILAVDER